MKLALEASGLDAAQMAAALGVTPQTVHNYLRGSRMPIKAVVKEWARACDVPYEWIVTGETITSDETPGNLGIIRCFRPDLVSA